MGNDHKKIIIVMVEQLDESDIRFLVHLNTMRYALTNNSGGEDISLLFLFLSCQLILH